MNKLSALLILNLMIGLSASANYLTCDDKNEAAAINVDLNTNNITYGERGGYENLGLAAVAYFNLDLKRAAKVVSSVGAGGYGFEYSVKAKGILMSVKCSGVKSCSGKAEVVNSKGKTRKFNLACSITKSPIYLNNPPVYGNQNFDD